MRFLRLALCIIGVLAVLFLYFATLHPYERVADHVFFDEPGPWAIAHRGGSGLWPENTLYAFEKAADLGVDMLEMDLRATTDGIIVVMHDAAVDRTTNGTGRVDGMTLAEIRKLDAGYSFEDASGQFPFRGQGITVPTFADVLSRLPSARLNVEMKDFSPVLAADLCRLLKENQAGDRVLVASFDHDVMLAFRQSCLSVATSATFREGMIFYQLSRIHLQSLYRGPAVALQAPQSLNGQQVLEPRLLGITEEVNLQVQVFTVNEEADMRRLLDVGVQGIITDYPDLLLRMMGRESGVVNESSAAWSRSSLSGPGPSAPYGPSRF